MSQLSPASRGPYRNSYRLDLPKVYLETELKRLRHAGAISPDPARYEVHQIVDPGVKDRYGRTRVAACADWRAVEAEAPSCAIDTDRRVQEPCGPFPDRKVRYQKRYFAIYDSQLHVSSPSSSPSSSKPLPNPPTFRGGYLNALFESCIANHRGKYDSWYGTMRFYWHKDQAWEVGTAVSVCGLHRLVIPGTTPPASRGVGDDNILDLSAARLFRRETPQAGGHFFTFSGIELADAALLAAVQAARSAETTMSAAIAALGGQFATELNIGGRTALERYLDDRKNGVVRREAPPPPLRYLRPSDHDVISTAGAQLSSSAPAFRPGRRIPSRSSDPYRITCVAYGPPEPAPFRRSQSAKDAEVPRAPLHMADREQNGTRVGGGMQASRWFVKQAESIVGTELATTTATHGISAGLRQMTINNDSPSVQAPSSAVAKTMEDIESRIARMGVRES
ncbi:hypothetical protein EDC01DRAFT_636395 [Geopyxis carbonaria]|nr:hypothetical protein EDC01DRAFT_636395 [Geopyxis carbonaria]